MGRPRIMLSQLYLDRDSLSYICRALKISIFHHDCETDLAKGVPSKSQGLKLLALSAQATLHTVQGRPVAENIGGANCNFWCIDHYYQLNKLLEVQCISELCSLFVRCLLENLGVFTCLTAYRTLRLCMYPNISRNTARTAL